MFVFSEQYLFNGIIQYITYFALLPRHELRKSVSMTTVVKSKLQILFLALYGYNCTTYKISFESVTYSGQGFLILT